MAVPATCNNCTNDSDTSNTRFRNSQRNGPLSLAVILGVLGGMALIFFLVFLIVPLVRRRQARGAYHAGDVGSWKSTLGSVSFKPGSSFISFGRNKPPVRHHHNVPGPDALLPLTLPTMSTFTWSEMRSHRSSLDTDEMEDVDRFELDSIPTDNATTSHRSKDDQTQVRSGASRSLQDAHHVHALAASSLLSPQRSPSPPGLWSRHSSAAGHKDSVQVSPIFQDTSSTGLPSHPTASVTAAMSSSRLDNLPVSSQANYYSRLENGSISGKVSEATSRPGSIQLPSPPDSPPFPAQAPAQSQPMRSRSTRSYSQTSQNGPPDYRFNPSRLRPTLNNAHAHSAPSTALPFRPTSGSSAPPLSSSSARLPSTPHLTSAFRNPVVSSSSGSTSSGAASNAVPCPAVITSPPPSAMRSRSGSIASVASERPARTPMESRLKPSNLRRASMSSNALPPPSPMGPGAAANHNLLSPSAPDASGVSDSPSSSRAYLRMSESHHTPQYDESPNPQGRSTSSSYFESDARGRSRAAMASSSSLAQTHTSPSSFSLHPLSASRQSSRGPSSHTTAYVKKKDSPALRPLPTSPFLYSPPQSPPSRSRSGTVTSGVLSPYAGSRSRAGSIRTLGEPPREREKETHGHSRAESIAEEHAGVDRRRSSRAILPPLQPISPLDFESESFSGSYARSQESRKNY